MKEELEALIWNAGQEEEIGYSKETLIKIIDALLNDFQEFIGHEFARNSYIFFDYDCDYFPNFSIWISGDAKENSAFTTKWLTEIGADMGIKNENSHFPIKWLAAMGGGMKPVLNSSKEVFEVDICMFIFPLDEERRIHLKNNESVIDFVFEKESNGRGKWKCKGWYPDYYGEWDYEFEYFRYLFFSNKAFSIRSLLFVM